MLGKIVDVLITAPLNSRSIDGSILYPVNVAEISDSVGNMAKYPVYIMRIKKPVVQQRVRIIASISNEEGKQIGFVAGPISEHIYEPEIREKLSSVFAEDVKYYCLYEKSCGMLVYRKKRYVQYLLIRNRNGCYWSFPKGHIELGETEEQTAQREVKEETNLSVEIQKGFRETTSYNPRSRIHKDVVFFIGHLAQDIEVKIQEEEIESYRWVDYQTAMNLFVFDNDKRVIRSARKWLVDNYKI